MMRVFFLMGIRSRIALSILTFSSSAKMTIAAPFLRLSFAMMSSETIVNTCRFHPSMTV